MSDLSPGEPRTALVTVAEARRLDEYTINVIGIPAWILMDNAGRAAFDIVAAHWGPLADLSVAVLAGHGNNGGDGYVVARCFKQAGCRVALWEAAVDPTVLSAAASHHRQAAWAVGVRPQPLAEFTAAGLAADGSRPVIIDALLGIGLQGPVRKPYAAAINAANALARQGVPVIALDTPSGLDADTGTPLGTAARAAMTITFAPAKMGLLQGPAIPYTGRLVTAPIGLDVSTIAPAATLSLPGVAGARFRQFASPAALAHKGVAGRCLIVGGARGMTGAASLAARGALRTGAGTVTVALPAAQVQSLAVLPEAMTLPLPDHGTGQPTVAATAVLGDWLARHAVGAALLGPGLGDNDGAAALVAGFLPRLAAAGIPTVLDADALNLLARNPAAAATVIAAFAPAAPHAGGDRGPGLVLTPHPAEAARLLGRTTAAVQANRPGAAVHLANTWQAVVILKGARSLVAVPGEPYRLSPVVEQALAAGGSGDVLGGMVAALLAARWPAAVAAETAVMTHGVAAALALAALTANGAPVPWAELVDTGAADFFGRGAGGVAGDGWRRGLLAGEVADAVPRAAALLATTDQAAAAAVLSAYGLDGFEPAPAG